MICNVAGRSWRTPAAATSSAPEPNLVLEDLEDEFLFQTPEEVFPTVDPITKLPLTDPVQNKFCKHIYGKAAMLELIAKNSKFRYDLTIEISTGSRGIEYRTVPRSLL